MAEIKRNTGGSDKNIVCVNCAHGKVWHWNEGRCDLGACDCEAWVYGVNVTEAATRGDTG